MDKFGCSSLNYAKIYKNVMSHLEKKGVNMRDIPPIYGKANEIMERYRTKMLRSDEIEEISLSYKDYSNYSKKLTKDNEQIFLYLIG
ncbi:MAG: hypothetical protein ACR5KW_04590 [Wolbachia sp.]